MKSIVFSIVVALVAGAVFADESVNVKSPVSPKNRAQYAQYRRAEAIAKLGGQLIAPVTGRVVRFVNRQKIVDVEILRSTAETIGRTSTIGVEVVDEEPNDGRSAATLRLIDRAGAPVIVVAPENFWAELNIAQLASDSPTPKTLENRVRKELYRAFCLLLGAGNSIYQPCLMRTVSSLKELDAITMFAPCPEAVDIIQRTADEYEIGRHRTVTYKRACEEGWAPSPTNDVQKAIWDKVHELPSEPIKISPETKKVTE